MVRERGSAIVGASAVLGGMVWVVHTLLLAIRPVGCVGEACFEAGRHHRQSEDLAWVLLISVLLLAFSAGITARRRDLPSGRARITAFGLLALGAVLLIVGMLANAGSPSGSPLWWLHDSDTLGRLLPVAGTLAAGIAAIKAPGGRWLAPLLIGSAVSGFWFNAQDERALLSIPVGLAWMAYGAHRLSRGTRRAAAIGARTGAGQI